MNWIIEVLPWKNIESYSDWFKLECYLDIPFPSISDFHHKHLWTNIIFFWVRLETLLCYNSSEDEGENCCNISLFTFTLFFFMTTHSNSVANIGSELANQFPQYSLVSSLIYLLYTFRSVISFIHSILSA